MCLRLGKRLSLGITKNIGVNFNNWSVLSQKIKKNISIALEKLKSEASKVDPRRNNNHEQ